MTDDIPVIMPGQIVVRDDTGVDRIAVVGHIGPGDVNDDGTVSFPLNGCPGCPACGRHELQGRN